MLKPHWEAVSQAQRRLLALLGPVTRERGFCLGGGTAVALLLGHRQSEDLDFFTGAEMGDPMILATSCAETGVNGSVLSVQRGTLHMEFLGVRVSFLEYRYPLLEPCVQMEDVAIQLASLDDLACMKLAALAQRGAKKDFLDVYALATAHRPLPEMLPLYQKKYSLSDVSHLLYSLSYFDDAEKERTPRSLTGLKWPHVRSAFVKWTRELADIA